MTTYTRVAIDTERTLTSHLAPDLRDTEEKQQTAWASGDFSIVGTTLQIVGEQIAEAANVRAGDYVLDVGAGNGNATLAAARRFARVVSTDYVPQLLRKGAERAKAEGLEVDFQVANAETLPFEDNTFNVVLSTFGVMFAGDQRRAARELVRVTRKEGRIGLANWTATGFVGQLFQLVASYVPPAAGTESPMLWGSESFIRELFGEYASDIECRRRIFNFRYFSAAHWIAVFRMYYGPTHKAFLALDPSAQAQLTKDLSLLLNELNTDAPRSLVVPGEYLEIVITKR